ncbi:MAG: RDD family protein [Acidimicrobiales bacterium]
MQPTSSGSPIPSGPESFPATGRNALAKVGLRAVARLLDLVVIGVPLVLVVAVALLATGYDPDTATEAETLPPWLVATWFGAVFSYETVAVALTGRTLGKLAVGIRVARLDDGGRPLWWQAGIRVALPAVVATIPNPLTQLVYVGIYLTSQFDAMGRGIHDKAAGTIVVTTR